VCVRARVMYVRAFVRVIVCVCARVHVCIRMFVGLFVYVYACVRESVC